MNNKLATATAFASLLVVGCGTNQVRLKDVQLPPKDSRVGIAIVGGELNGHDSTEIDISPEGLKAIGSHCLDIDAGATEVSSGAVWPVIATGAKYIFDRYMDKRIQETKAIEKRSHGSYSSRVHVKAAELQNAQCLVVYRSSNGEKSPSEDMLIILEVEHIPEETANSFRFRPVYRYVDRAAVFTPKVDHGSHPPRINVAVGVSVKTIGQSSNGVPVLAHVGTSTVSISGLQLGRSSSEGCEDTRPCATSELIPHVAEADQILSVTISVSEQGFPGFGFEQQAAELAAFREAFGPVLKDVVTNVTSED